MKSYRLMFQREFRGHRSSARGTRTSNVHATLRLRVRVEGALKPLENRDETFARCYSLWTQSFSAQEPQMPPVRDEDAFSQLRRFKHKSPESGVQKGCPVHSIVKDPACPSKSPPSRPGCIHLEPPVRLSRDKCCVAPH